MIRIYIYLLMLFLVLKPMVNAIQTKEIGEILQKPMLILKMSIVLQ